MPRDGQATNPYPCPPHVAAPSISISGATYRYPRATSPALDDVSLEISAGTMVALLGPNGSGKSTLLKLIAQVDRPQRGSITIGGTDRPASIRAMLGMVFQSPSLDPRMTVLENLRAYAVLAGAGSDAGRRINELLEAMGLSDRASNRVGTLSLGLARRVDLCRALLHAPRLLLLDEPTAGLDPPSRERFLGTIAEVHRRDGATVVISTHLVDEADACDRVVMMHRGRIAADGTPAQLRSSMGPKLLSVTGGTEPPELADLEGSRWTRRAGGWTIPLPDDPTASTRLAPLLAPLLADSRSFSVAPPTLADLFAAVTGEELAPAPSESPSKPRSRHSRKERSS